MFPGSINNVDEENGFRTGNGEDVSERSSSDLGDGVVESDSSDCCFARNSVMSLDVFPPNGDSERRL